MKLLTLEETLRAEKKDLWAHYAQQADKQGNGFLLFLPGDKRHRDKIVLIAHADTVHDMGGFWRWECAEDVSITKSKEIFHDTAKQVFWSPQGLGADDRAGVFAVMHIYFALRGQAAQPVVLLTDGEESGGSGACEAAYKLNLLKTCSYLVELDRRGFSEAVFYDDVPQDFIAHILRFGFGEHIGSFSDISIIAPIWRLCSVNLSVGYVDEHTHTEHLYVAELQRTIDKVLLLLAEHAKEPRAFAPPFYGKKKSKRQRCRKRKQHFSSSWYDPDSYREYEDYATSLRERGERGKYREFSSYLVRCKQCEKLIDIATDWGSECPKCGYPLSL